MIPVTGRTDSLLEESCRPHKQAATAWHREARPKQRPGARQARFLSDVENRRNIRLSCRRVDECRCGVVALAASRRPAFRASPSLLLAGPFNRIQLIKAAFRLAGRVFTELGAVHPCLTAGAPDHARITWECLEPAVACRKYLQADRLQGHESHHAECGMACLSLVSTGSTNTIHEEFMAKLLQIQHFVYHIK